MKTRLLGALAVAVAALAVATPAHADVSVTFGVSVGRYLPTGAACQLSVAAGADGIDVLEAAKAAHCIVSYDVDTFGTSHFLRCIDEVCGAGPTSDEPVEGYGTYWNMYENGVSTAYGVDDFSATAGDELVFAYKPYCFNSDACPPDLDSIP